jgi:putative component of toxin-antitoxin plasmid stabilization module
MPAKWIAQFYEDANGRSPAKIWMDDLSVAKYAALRAAIKHVLEVQGLSLSGTLWMTPLGDGLYEFRVKHSERQILEMYSEIGGDDLPAKPPEKILLRVFVHFHGNRIVLLLGGYDKGKDDSDKKQRAEIKVAQRALGAWRRQEVRNHRSK